ncbi:MAG: YkgJ family cysteine cluster protein [Deltaproteobacteria bacterium]|nr:YkgJ family cysteine cluster protein [Deltaproteobacteria bacterium]
MDIDLKSFLDRYEKVSAQSDAAFKHVSEAHPELVRCKKGCSDCCYALFDLTLIEALYINYQFNEKMSGNEKTRLIEEANRIDRATYRVKRKAFKDVSGGKNEVEVLMELAKERMRCPLLNKEDLCLLYENRPITCRVYGIPTSSGGMGHTCGLSGFSEGAEYPTVNLDAIQKQLLQITSDFLTKIKSKNIKMVDMLIPLSMAIITEFDEVFLGLKEDQEVESEKKVRRKK